MITEFQNSSCWDPWWFSFLDECLNVDLLMATEYLFWCIKASFSFLSLPPPEKSQFSPMFTFPFFYPKCASFIDYEEKGELFFNTWKPIVQFIASWFRFCLMFLLLLCLVLKRIDTPQFSPHQKTELLSLLIENQDCVFIESCSSRRPPRRRRLLSLFLVQWHCRRHLKPGTANKSDLVQPNGA